MRWTTKRFESYGEAMEWSKLQLALCQRLMLKAVCFGDEPFEGPCYIEYPSLFESLTRIGWGLT